jgi:hypothetical protein
MIRIVILILALFSCKKDVGQSPFFDYNNTTPLTEYNYRQKQFLSKEEVIPYDSKTGMKLFLEADYKDDTFRLGQYFAGQQYISTCGPASLRIVLSALYRKMEKTPPLDKQHSLFKETNGMDYFVFNFTEENVFEYIQSDSDFEQYDIITRQTKTKNGGFGSGMGGGNIVNVAKSHAGITAKYTPANRDSISITQGEFKKLVDAKLNCTKNCNVLQSKRHTKTIEDGIRKFREDIISTLKSDEKFMIAYFSHVKTLPGKFSGHFSPLVAFNAKADKVLIMDVASHLGGWYWVSVEDLYKAMSYDVGAGERGYIVAGLEENNSLSI